MGEFTDPARLDDRAAVGDGIPGRHHPGDRHAVLHLEHRGRPRARRRTAPPRARDGLPGCLGPDRGTALVHGRPARDRAASRRVAVLEHPRLPAAIPASPGDGDDDGGVTAAGAGAGIVVLQRDDATLSVDPEAGGRLASLEVGGYELLVTRRDGPILWGCYPMAPFAGRIRDGRFRFHGRSYQLPLTMPPNAIHGTVLDRPWSVTARSDHRVALATDLGPDWPFEGHVVQSVGLVEGGLEATLELRAAEPMPVVLGWH